jgi:hypothetical protein
MRLTRRVIWRAVWPAFAALALAGGCATSQNGSGPSSSSASEVEKLHAQRDRAFADAGLGPAVPATEPATPSAAPRPNVTPPKPGAANALPDKPRPDWIGAGSSAAYPGDRYITGVGSVRKGATDDYAALTMAEDRARAELAKTIRVRVKSEFDSATQLVTTARAGAVVSANDTTSVSNQITSQTDMVLRGVQIADRWYDSKSDTCWAFAVLDRAATGATILDRATRARQEVDRDRELGMGFRKDGKSWQAASYLNRALKKSLSILGYRAYLRIIAPALVDNPALAPDPAMQSLWRDSALAAEDLRAAVIVFAHADDHPADAGSAEPELSGAMRRMGLKVVALEAGDGGQSYADMKGRSTAKLQKQFAGRANCLVLADFSAKEVTSQHLGALLIHFYRAKAEAVVFDLDSGRNVASTGFDWSAETQTGNADPARAAEATLQKAAQLVSEKLKAELAAGLNLMQ